MVESRLRCYNKCNLGISGSSYWWKHYRALPEASTNTMGYGIQDPAPEYKPCDGAWWFFCNISLQPNETFAQHSQKCHLQCHLCEQYCPKPMWEEHFTTIHSPCDLCKNWFRTTKDYENHACIAYSRIGNVQSTQDIYHNCSLCPTDPLKTMASHSTLQEHIKQVHVQCRICLKYYRTNPYLDEHMEREHPKCSSCPGHDNFSSPSAKRAHCRKRHRSSHYA